MARTSHRRRFLNLYIHYMISRLVVLPPRTLGHFVEELEMDAGVVQAILQTRYLMGRNPVRKKESLSLVWDYATTPHEYQRFTNMVRVSPSTFDFILHEIKDHSIFQTRGNRPQAPVQIQLAVCLYRMGRYGNGASVEDIARIAGVSEGTVEAYTHRCLVALFAKHSQFVRKPSDTEIEREKDWIEDNVGIPEWREGWIMYDGTIVVLYSKPGMNGDAYYTRKSNYGFNVQIGNLPSNLYIADYSCGMTGSAHDANAFQHTAAGRYPDWFFKGNEFAWADSAYTLTSRMIPIHKRPAALIHRNMLFDTAVSHLRVRSEHCMGSLKGRWQSLRGLRLCIYSNRHHVLVCRWIAVCIILHNICVGLESANDMDFWRSQYDMSEEPAAEVGEREQLPSVVNGDGTARREELIDALMAHRQD